jgi:hypothetical protein
MPNKLKKLQKTRKIKFKRPFRTRRRRGGRLQEKTMRVYKFQIREMQKKRKIKEMELYKAEMERIAIQERIQKLMAERDEALAREKAAMELRAKLQERILQINGRIV